MILSVRRRNQKRAFVEKKLRFRGTDRNATSWNARAAVLIGASDQTTVPKTFKIQDHVCWNSEAGRVTGTIIRVHTRKFEVKGYTYHASTDDPQYEVRSSKTDHIAFHKGAALLGSAIHRGDAAFRTCADAFASQLLIQGPDRFWHQSSRACDRPTRRTGEHRASA